MTEKERAQAKLLLKAMFGDWADWCRHPSSHAFLFRKDGLYVEYEYLTFEKDGQVKIQDFQALFLVNGQEPEVTGYRGNEVLLTLDQPSSNLSDLVKNNPTITAFQFKEVERKKMISWNPQSWSQKPFSPTSGRMELKKGIEARNPTTLPPLPRVPSWPCLE
jgi:hypothetical protein